MEFFNENFKIQDMIDSDMRCELDDYMSVFPGGSPALSHLLPMDLDTGMHSDPSDDGMGVWMDNSQIYNGGSDLDSVGGLLVNPQTALPVTATPLTPSSTTLSVTSSPFSRAVNLTLTPQSNHAGESSTTSSGVTVPVHVITTTTTVTDRESKPSQVNLTVAVPTSETPLLKTTKGTQASHLMSFQNSLQEADDVLDNPKSRSKQNKNLKLSKPVSICNENSYPKPAYSYSCLIAMALKNSKTGSLPVNEIYDFMTENFPYFKTAPNGWKNSVRHNLSLNKCFEKIEKPTTNGAQRKGYLWALNPSKVEKMEEELQKWGSKDPDAIRKSMANPERLELIEKGELNSTADEGKFTTPVVNNRISKKQVQVKEEPADSSINADFSPLDAPVGMDPALPEFDLQKGIWEHMCDDRLFIRGSPINSSSPKHASSNITLDEDSLRAVSPSDLPKSFVHANYIYSCSRLSSELSNDEVSTQPMMEKTTTVCDA